MRDVEPTRISCGQFYPRRRRFRLTLGDDSLKFSEPETSSQSELPSVTARYVSRTVPALGRLHQLGQQYHTRPTHRVSILQPEMLCQAFDCELVSHATGGVLNREQTFLPVRLFTRDGLEPFDSNLRVSDLRIVGMLPHFLGSEWSLQDGDLLPALLDRERGHGRATANHALIILPVAMIS